VTCGVVYVATGVNYVKGAAISIATLRQFYAGPVMLLTDGPAAYFAACAEKYNVMVNVQATGETNQGLSSRVLKTQAAKFCPYETALFLDVDTLVLKPIHKLWGYPTAAQPIAMTVSEAHERLKDAAKAPHMRFPSYVRDLHATCSLAGPNSPHYCSSTIVWKRTPQLLHMFEVWCKEWLRVKGPDMFALARALHKAKLPVVLLPRCFSLRKCVKSSTVVHTPRITQLARACEKYCPVVNKTLIVDQKKWGWV
jgi:hypothetical protein